MNRGTYKVISIGVNGCALTKWGIKAFSKVNASNQISNLVARPSNCGNILRALITTAKLKSISAPELITLGMVKTSRIGECTTRVRTRWITRSQVLK